MHIWIADGLLPKEEAIISFFVFFWQLSVALFMNIQGIFALFLRTEDFIHDTDLID